MRSAESSSGAEELLLDLLRRRTGMRTSEASRREALRVGRERAASLDQSFDAWVESLGGTSNTSELELVVRALTVGETYFFRGPVFGVLRSAVLPELVARKRRQGTNVVRVASAGCATGEEAYSLALCLRTALEDASRWNLGVLGFDLNAAFLERAACADFGAWSFRGTDPAAWGPWLRRVGEQWTVHPEIRKMVRFEYVNLANDPMPAPALGLVGLDLVLCQNVLIYFEREVRERTVRSLAQVLAPGGHIFFGPADLVSVELPGCELVQHGDVVGYRRVELREPAPRRRPSSAVLRAITSFPPAASPSPAAAELVAPPVEPAHVELASPAPVVASFERARALADQGEVVTALEELEALRELGSEDANVHTLHGLLLTDVGALPLAIESFRRAIYLDPGALLPQLGAFVAARQLGDAGLARRYGARTRALARALPAEAPVEGWAGMTVARVLELVERAGEVSS